MAQDTADLSDIPQMSYEEAREELVRLVARIESGEAPLEESMALWERGEALAAHCQATLDRAQEHLDRSGRATADNPQQVAPVAADAEAPRDEATETPADSDR